MEVKRICQWCGKPFIAKKTTTCYCSPQCSKRGYKHRMMERKMELRHMQEMQELRSSLEKQEYFTFSQAARLMGVSRQYIYKLVKEEKLRASRLSGKMSLIRRADIELMLKSKPYERMVPKEDFKITEYYTAEEIAQKYKVNAKWVWTYTRQHKIPKVKVRQFNYYSKKHIDAAFAKYKTDDALTEWYTPEDIQEKYGMTVSDYILSCAYNFKPKARLTKEEEALLQNLDNCRSDLVKYTSALHGMSTKQRMVMFNQIPFMVGWLGELSNVAEGVCQFLEAVKEKNRIPSNPQSEEK